MSRTYVINDSRAVSTAITILQIKAVSCSLEIVRAWVNQESSTVSAQTAIQLNRKITTAASVTSLTPLLLEPNGAAALAVGGAAATGRTATAEGTDSDVLIREGFNVLNGWLYLPVPEERIVLSPLSIATSTLGLKFPVAPPNVTYDYGIVFREIG